MTTVSVIIPLFNREKLIQETIENLLSQSRLPDEIIVVDDGSSDKSAEIVQKFPSPVRLICQDNKGPSSARNKGLKEAKSEFIQFIDSDDLISLNKIEYQLRILHEENADIAYGPWIKVLIKDHKLTSFGHVLQQKKLPSSRKPAQWLVTDWSTILQSCLFRKKILDQINPFSVDLFNCEDLLFLVEAFLKSSKVIFTPNCLTLYRVGHSDKLSLSGETISKDKKIMDHIHYLCRSRSLFKKYNLKDPLFYFSYRYRLYYFLSESQESISSYLERDMEDLLGNEKMCFFYFVYAVLERFRGGVLFRLKGDRSHYSFGSLPINDLQLRLISEMGFVLKSN